MLWVVQSASTSGAANDALRRVKLEGGGTNDVTVSNRVNLVDPSLRICPLSYYVTGFEKRGHFAQNMIFCHFQLATNSSQ